MANDTVKEAIFCEIADVMAAAEESDGEVDIDIAVGAAFTIGLHLGILLDRGHPAVAAAVLRTLRTIQGAEGGNAETEAAIERLVAAVPSRVN
jgi:hypothetical protein